MLGKLRKINKCPDIVSPAKCLNYFRIFAQNNINTDIFGIIKSALLAVIASEINAIYKKQIYDYAIECLQSHQDEIGINIKVFTPQDLQNILLGKIDNAGCDYTYIYNENGKYYLDNGFDKIIISANILHNIIRLISDRYVQISPEPDHGITYIVELK